MLNAYQVPNTPEGFKTLFATLQKELISQPAFVVGSWQSQQVDTPMRELRNVSFSMKMPDTDWMVANATGAHLPWAEDHFQERVGGEPLNPSPSEAWWPFAQNKDSNSNAAHKSEGAAFSHTYPERMWPKMANGGVTKDVYSKGIRIGGETSYHRGIRFEYGDLDDVVNQLTRDPHTRQAFLPIWFPEDTGVVHGKRVPCTLGYHFAIRDGKLDITYYMRSTDLLRHFQDDIYLAIRLAQWMVAQLNRGKDPQFFKDIKVGELIFHTANLHIFDGDVPMIEYRRSQGNYAWAE